MVISHNLSSHKRTSSSRESWWRSLSWLLLRCALFSFGEMKSSFEHYFALRLLSVCWWMAMIAAKERWEKKIQQDISVSCRTERRFFLWRTILPPPPFWCNYSRSDVDLHCFMAFCGWRSIKSSFNRALFDETEAWWTFFTRWSEKWADEALKVSLKSFMKGDVSKWC